MFKNLATGMSAAIAAATIGAPLAAQNVTADIDRIVTVLQKEGFQAKREGSGRDARIDTKFSGYSSAIYFYGCDEAGANCKTVQLYAGFTPDTKPTLEAMNSYASENRFGRVYLDKDKDPVIEMDIDLEAGGMSEALFMDNLAYWSTIVESFADFVFEDE